MSEQKIELVPLQFIKPLPGNVTTIGREEDMMLRTDMTRIESRGLYKIDPIFLRRLTPEEIQDIRSKYPFAIYELIDGHSRWNAARELGWNQIRAIIIDATREEALEKNYMKNKARGSIDPLREAMYFRHLHEDLKMDTFKIAEKFGITHGRVSQILQRAKIDKEVRRKIVTRVTKGLSGKHLEAIASLRQPEKQMELTDAIIEGKLSRREAEKAKEAIEKGLPKEEAVKAAKTSIPQEKIEIGQIRCPECGTSYNILHIDTGKHKLEKLEG